MGDSNGSVASMTGRSPVTTEAAVKDSDEAAPTHKQVVMIWQREVHKTFL